ncbi:MAG: hypothetical protein AABW48_05400 [Nanoarchaeota archaeon]
MKKRKLLLLSVMLAFSLVFIFYSKPLLLLAGQATNQDLFNLEVEIPETYEEILAGEDLWFTTTVLNLANTNRIDIVLKYEILDVNGELKILKSETVAVETKASVVGNLKVPTSLEQGLYFLRVILISPIGTSEAETSFKVIKQ